MQWFEFWNSTCSLEWLMLIMLCLWENKLEVFGQLFVETWVMYLQNSFKKHSFLTTIYDFFVKFVVDIFVELDWKSYIVKRHMSPTLGGILVKYLWKYWLCICRTYLKIILCLGIHTQTFGRDICSAFEETFVMYL